jgi:hypothetical protein
LYLLDELRSAQRTEQGIRISMLKGNKEDLQMISLLQSPPFRIRFLRALGFGNKHHFINKSEFQDGTKETANLEGGALKGGSSQVLHGMT